MNEQTMPDPGGPSTPPTAPAPIHHPLEYFGEAKALGWLVFKNTILTIITIGFYRFWGKTRIRKHIWSSLSLFGEKLEYTGTGKELFLGFLIVMAVLVPLGIVVNVGNFYLQTLGNNHVLFAFQATYSLLFLFLFGYAVFRARRYQLSRTVWRSIRFAQAGEAKKYALKFFGYWLLAVLTLGLAAPLALVRLQTYLINNTFLGQEKFSLDAQVKDIFWKAILCGILAPFTLYLSMLWFAAFYTRYIVSKTHFGPLKLALPITFGDLAKIYIPYILVIVLIFAVIAGPVIFAALNLGSIGDINAAAFVPITLVLILFFFLPTITAMMITHRLLGLFANKLEAEGEIDLDAFVQNAQQASGTGEGLADALDVGGAAGIEVGL